MRQIEYLIIICSVILAGLSYSGAATTSDFSSASILVVILAVILLIIVFFQNRSFMIIPEETDKVVEESIKEAPKSLRPKTQAEGAVYGVTFGIATAADVLFMAGGMPPLITGFVWATSALAATWGLKTIRRRRMLRRKAQELIEDLKKKPVDNLKERVEYDYGKWEKHLMEDDKFETQLDRVHELVRESL